MPPNQLVWYYGVGGFCKAKVEAHDEVSSNNSSDVDMNSSLHQTKTNVGVCRDPLSNSSSEAKSNIGVCDDLSSESLSDVDINSSNIPKSSYDPSSDSSSDTYVAKSAFQNNCDDNGCQQSRHYKKHKHSKQAKQDNFVENILQSQKVIISNIGKQFLSDESLVDVDNNQSKLNSLNPWGDMNVQDIPMDIKYMQNSNSCPTSHEIEEKMDVQNHIHSNSDSTSDSRSDENCSSSSSDYSV